MNRFSSRHSRRAAAGAAAFAATLGLSAIATPASASPTTTTTDATSAVRASSTAPGLQVTCTVAGTHAGGQPISTSATTRTVPHFLVDVSGDSGVPYPDPSGRQTIAGGAPGANAFSPQLVVGNDAFNNGTLIAPTVLLDGQTGVPRIYIAPYVPAATSTALQRIYARNLDRGRALSMQISELQWANTFYPDYRDLVTPLVKPLLIPAIIGGKLVGEPATLTCQR